MTEFNLKLLSKAAAEELIKYLNHRVQVYQSTLIQASEPLQMYRAQGSIDALQRVILDVQHTHKDSL